MRTLIFNLKQERSHDLVSEVVEELPDIFSIQEPVLIGAFSWTLMGSRKRLLLKDAVRWLDLIACTPSELARMYLDCKYGTTKRRVNRHQLSAITIPRSPPIYSQARRLEGVAYVDIQAAYWSIVRIVGWDVDYSPGQFMGKQSEMDDFPFADDKLVRNLLVTAGLPKHTQVWTGSEMSVKPSFNKLLNHGIWAVCQDVLHAIADDMLRIGAYYVHTDGYIVDIDRVGLAIEILESWGLSGKVKAEGNGFVSGVGHYQIGGERTRQQYFKPSPHPPNFRVEHKAWLRRNMRAWAGFMMTRNRVDTSSL